MSHSKPYQRRLLYMSMNQYGYRVKWLCAGKLIEFQSTNFNALERIERRKEMPERERAYEYTLLEAYQAIEQEATTFYNSQFQNNDNNSSNFTTNDRHS